MLSVDNRQSINSETCSTVSKEGTTKTSNHDELQYLELIQNILDNGTRKEDRTGNTKSDPALRQTGRQFMRIYGTDIVLMYRQILTTHVNEIIYITIPLIDPRGLIFRRAYYWGGERFIIGNIKNKSLSFDIQA